MSYFIVNTDLTVRKINLIMDTLPPSLAEAIKITTANWPYTIATDADGVEVIIYESIQFPVWNPVTARVEEDNTKVAEATYTLLKDNLKLIRDEAIIAPFTTASGKTFDVSSLADRENIEGAYARFAELTAYLGKSTITWTLHNSMVPQEQEVTDLELKEVMDGFAIRKLVKFAEYQAAKALL